MSILTKIQTETIQKLETEHLAFLSTLPTNKKPEDFTYKPTCSSGKNYTESYQDEIIGPVLRILNKEHKGFTATLIGSKKGLKRQLKRYVKNHGTALNRVIIFELNARCANSLKKEVARLGLSCTVICCDINKGIAALSQVGINFYYVEADGVMSFGTLEPKLWNAAKKYDIPIIISQGSGRGQHKWFKSEAKSLKVRRRTNKNGFKYYDLTVGAVPVLKKHLKQYDSHLVTYGGRESDNGRDGRRTAAPMYMAISIKTV